MLYFSITFFSLQYKNYYTHPLGTSHLYLYLHFLHSNKYMPISRPYLLFSSLSTYNDILIAITFKVHRTIFLHSIFILIII